MITILIFLSIAFVMSPILYSALWVTNNKKPHVSGNSKHEKVKDDLESNCAAVVIDIDNSHSHNSSHNCSHSCSSSH